MEATVKKFVAEMTTSFDPSDIRGSSGKLRDALTRWRNMNKFVETTLIGLLKIITSSCVHKGAQHGSNERDGSWMNTCPTCGHSS